MSKHEWESINRESFSVGELGVSSLLSEVECALCELSAKEIGECVRMIDRTDYEDFGKMLADMFLRMRENQK